MGEVQQQDVDKIKHQHNFGEEIVTFGEQNRPKENAQVECSEVPANKFGKLGSAGYVGAVCNWQEDLSDESELRNVKHYPVNSDEERACTKWSFRVVVGVTSKKVLDTHIEGEDP